MSITSRRCISKKATWPFLLVGPLFFAFIIIGLPRETPAQGFSSEIIGRTIDQSGAAVPGVRISATRVETRDSYGSISDAEGDFIFSMLVPGRYQLSAERTGFKALVVNDVVVHVDQPARVNITLEVGDLATSVDVPAGPIDIDSENADLGSIILNREIVDIPLNGRNYLSLALLSPGVAAAPAGANPFNINGARADHVNFLLDGVANINRRGNESVVTPSIDAIEEFKVITNGYSAEYGRLAAGEISVALKSGGNSFHGSLFEFLRNDKLDARSFFDPARLKLERNQFGGVASGPFYRNRTFFLVSFEGLRNVQGQTSLTRVPTLLERSGVFATNIRNPFTGQLFSGNTVTPGLINTISQQLLTYFPLPNRSGVLNFSTADTIREEQNNGIAKVDHRFDSRNYLVAEFLINSGTLRSPFRSTALPGFGARRKTNRRLWSAQYTRIFTNRVINQMRIGGSDDRFDESSINAGKSTSRTLGITGVADGFGLADIVIAGFPELGDATFLPDRWRDREISFSDTLSVAAGSHNLKLGGEFQHSRFSSIFAAFAGGQIAFNGAFSLNPFADFLLGLPVQTQRQVGTNTTDLRSDYFGLYVQDDWRILDRLSLSLGVRFDMDRPPVEKNDRWANFIVSERRQIAAGTAGYPRSMLRTANRGVSPRIGFAYRSGGDRPTVLRGGYGIFDTFDLQFTQYQLLGASAFPFTRLELFQAIAVGNPSLGDPFPNRPGLTPGALSPNGWEYDNPTSYVQSWNLTAGTEFAGRTLVEVSYVGSKGTHLSSTANINQTIRTPQGNVVPFPGFGRVLFQRLRANSNYNALQATVQKRMSAGLSFRSGLTWSKSIDNASFGSPARLPQDPNDQKAERGLSEFDRRVIWNSDVIYELPVGRGRYFGRDLPGWADGALGGWQVSGIFQFSTGRPFTPVVSTANTQAGFASRPDRIGSGVLGDPTVGRWFDAAAFVVVPANQFRFGSSGRDILTGPGAVSVDIALLKNFALPFEGQKIQFRAEIFNLPNVANFGQPDARIDQPTAGAISSAGPGRQIQFGLKYVF